MAKKHFDVEMLIFEKAWMKLSCFQDTQSLLATMCQVNEVWCVWTGTLPLTCYMWISLNTSKSFHTLQPWWRGVVHCWRLPHGSPTLLGNIVDLLKDVWNFFLSDHWANRTRWLINAKNKLKKKITVNRHLSFSMSFLVIILFQIRWKGTTKHTFQLKANTML